MRARFFRFCILEETRGTPSPVIMLGVFVLCFLCGELCKSQNIGALVFFVPRVILCFTGLVVITSVFAPGLGRII